MKKRTLIIVVMVVFVLGFICGTSKDVIENSLSNMLCPSKGSAVYEADYEKLIKKGKLAKYIKSVEGKDASQWGLDVKNPLSLVTDQGVEMFAKRGIDIREMAEFRAVLITGDYCGANSIDLVNTDPKVLLIIGKGFTTHGDIYSCGPVLAIEDAHFMGSIIATGLVWCIDKSCPRALTIGSPLVLADTIRMSQVRTITQEVWNGDYGLPMGVVNQAINADK
ncbi:MAG: hypothetical protein GY853_04945 [PVC group bacterium]|nr:hypothetical protein [PVC group bacterium]